MIQTGIMQGYQEYSYLSIFDGSLASVLAKGRQGSRATWRLCIVMSANINLPPVQELHL